MDDCAGAIAQGVCRSLLEFDVKGDTEIITGRGFDLSNDAELSADCDQARVMHLTELALDFARKHLKTGGDMVVKVFQGTGFMELRDEAMKLFESVQVKKPAASRDRSAETYLLARHKRA